MKNRKRHEIVADVLTAALNGSKKTNIMYDGKLSFKLLNFYLKITTNCGLLTLDPLSRLYFTTNKGKEFLEIHAEYKKNRQVLNNKSLEVKEKERQLENMLLQKDISYCI